MALSKDDILNAIAEMSVMDVVELVQSMEDKFGVSAAAAVAAAPAAADGDGAAAAEEQTEFDVVLTGPGEHLRLVGANRFRRRRGAPGRRGRRDRTRLGVPRSLAARTGAVWLPKYRTTNS